MDTRSVLGALVARFDQLHHLIAILSGDRHTGFAFKCVDE
jgi:hypothetical protein